MDSWVGSDSDRMVGRCARKRSRCVGRNVLGLLVDEGADAVRVVGHLAGTIASTHIPTGTSATRAVEQ
jgi:hypothetical protein